VCPGDDRRPGTELLVYLRRTEPDGCLFTRGNESLSVSTQYVYIFYMVASAVVLAVPQT